MFSLSFPNVKNTNILVQDGQQQQETEMIKNQKYLVIL